MSTNGCSQQALPPGAPAPGAAFSNVVLREVVAARGSHVLYRAHQHLASLAKTRSVFVHVVVGDEAAAVRFLRAYDDLMEVPVEAGRERFPVYQTGPGDGPWIYAVRGILPGANEADFIAAFPAPVFLGQ